MLGKDNVIQLEKEMKDKTFSFEDLEWQRKKDACLPYYKNEDSLRRTEMGTGVSKSTVERLFKGFKSAKIKTNKIG